MCGAAGAFSRNGVRRSGGSTTFAAASSWSASSLRHTPSRSYAPAATGFSAAARKPWRAKPCSNAAETKVLPISVSVPVTNRDRGAFMLPARWLR